MRKPATPGEIITWRKVRLTPDSPLGKRVVETASKLTARDYLSRLGYGKHLPNVFAVAHTPAEVLQLDLSKPSVLKAAHGSHMNLFIRQPISDSEIETYQQEMLRWLETGFGQFFGEWWYDLGPKAVLQEELHKSDDGLPDYKFFCIRGSVAMIQTDIVWHTAHKRRLYKPDWSPIDSSYCVPLEKMLPEGPDVTRPKLLDDMLALCENLSQPFDFVRIDLYEVSGPRIIVGELTHASDSGRGQFSNPALSNWLTEEYYRLNPMWPHIE